MIFESSRYRLVDIVMVLDPVTNALSQPPFPDVRDRVSSYGDDDSLPTASSARGWASLGLHHLGDAQHWWAIADLSGVVDPFTELSPGAQLRVPSTSRFLFQIMAPENER